MASLILTKSATNSIHQYNLSQGIIHQTIQNADKNFPGREPGITQFQKTYDYGSVTVVAKRTERGEWLVLSCWLKRSSNFQKSSPDARLKKASFLEKLWISVIKIFKL